MPLVQCVVPAPVRLSSLMSLLSQQNTTKLSRVMFDGTKAVWCSCCANILSAMATSISQTCVLDSELPKRFNSVTALVLPVICLIAIGKATCFGVLTHPRVTHCIKSWLIQRTCQWSASDVSFTRSRDIACSWLPMSPTGTQARKLCSELGKLKLFPETSSGLSRKGISFCRSMISDLKNIAPLNRSIAGAGCCSVG